MSVEKDFEQSVRDRLKKPEAILEESTERKLNLVHLAMGVSGEAGELLDAVKKNFAYNKPLDVENILEEMGDIEFYLEGLRQHFKVSRKDILNANIEKLSKRYPVTYSDADAHRRADKNGS